MISIVFKEKNQNVNIFEKIHVLSFSYLSILHLLQHAMLSHLRHLYRCYFLCQENVPLSSYLIHFKNMYTLYYFRESFLSLYKTIKLLLYMSSSNHEILFRCLLHFIVIRLILYLSSQTTSSMGTERSSFLSNHVSLAQCLVHEGYSKNICGIDVGIYMYHIWEKSQSSSKDILAIS